MRLFLSLVLCVQGSTKRAGEARYRGTTVWLGLVPRKYATQLRRPAQLRSGQKVTAAECHALGWPGRFSGELVMLLQERVGASGADDLVGGAEDFLGALFRYCFRIRSASRAEPVLDIAASVIGSFKAQRFAAK